MESSEVVTLKGGVSVMATALRLALTLEASGFTLTAHPDGQLEVQPVARLTPHDCRQIRLWRDELVRIARYEAPAI